MAPEEEKPQQIEAHEVKAITASISYYKMPLDGNLKSSRMVVVGSFFPPLSAKYCMDQEPKGLLLVAAGSAFVR